MDSLELGPVGMAWEPLLMDNMGTGLVYKHKGQLYMRVCLVAAPLGFENGMFDWQLLCNYWVVARMYSDRGLNSGSQTGNAGIRDLCPVM